MKIENVTVSEISDSRGDRTIEVTLKTASGVSSTKIPSGKSRGKNEAVPLGAKSASEVLGSGLLDKLKGLDIGSIREIDEFLINRDGTKNKSKLGGDLLLGISISFARALARERDKELWEVLRNEFFKSIEIDMPPKIFSNMINGGAHADNNLDIQEYQIVGMLQEGPEATTNALKTLHKKLGENLSKELELEDLPVGDEQGYSPDFKNNLEPLRLLSNLIRESGYEEFVLGIDAAATSFGKGGEYNFEGDKHDASSLLTIYSKYFSECDKLKFVEDPFTEDDIEGFKGIFEKFGDEKVLIGDDLTTTSAESIEKHKSLINGVIIKPNQIGTATETCEAMIEAKKSGIHRIVSHRSGEVDDTFLIHFAKAAAAEGVKIGLPVIKERAVKFEELIRIYS